MAETTDYADLVALQAALEAIADDPGGWSTHAVRGVTERAASAISALVRERESAREALAQTLVWIKDGEFDDGSEQNCPVEAIAPHGLLEQIEAVLSSAGDAEDR